MESEKCSELAFANRPHWAPCPAAAHSGERAADLSLDSNPDGRAQVRGAPGLLSPLSTRVAILQAAVVILLSEGREPV